MTRRLQMFRSGKSLIAAAAIAFGVLSATSANAATVTITPVAGVGNPNPVNVTFSDDVLGLVIGPPIGTSPTAATGFAFNGNAAEAATLLSSLAAGVFTAIGSNIDFANIPGVTGNSEVNTFTINFAFFALKSDGWIAFFKNVNGGPLTLAYDAISAPTQNGAGLSHIVNLGSVNPGTFAIPNSARAPSVRGRAGRHRYDPSP